MSSSRSRRSRGPLTVAVSETHLRTNARTQSLWTAGGRDLRGRTVVDVPTPWSPGGETEIVRYGGKVDSGMTISPGLGRKRFSVTRRSTTCRRDRIPARASLPAIRPHAAVDHDRRPARRVEHAHVRQDRRASRGPSMLKRHALRWPQGRVRHRERPVVAGLDPPVGEHAHEPVVERLPVVEPMNIRVHVCGRDVATPLKRLVNRRFVRSRRRPRAIARRRPILKPPRNRAGSTAVQASLQADGGAADHPRRVAAREATRLERPGACAPARTARAAASKANAAAVRNTRPHSHCRGAIVNRASM